ncbi:carbon-nitrogen hydrolase family protein [Fodinicola acaciae]|uniref:carbon-nitrogen hydrolase family protein n=1 Tax=Fodinicola acaciae TaxID=2681555 RepID=UPI0013D81F94|nr:carbon-nitrogen hydrolase family protein [Fodinicola acaciae]
MPLTIAVAQPECVAYGVTKNAETHAAVIRQADARVVVFSELSLTGYELDAPAIAADDPRLAPMVDACAATGSIALAGAPLRGDGDTAHIATLAIDGSGAAVAYRKIHLGGGEKRFTAGEKPAVLAVDGWRLGLAICRDTGIARHAADTAALGIDAYVAGIVEDDLPALDDRVRRITTDHSVWVAIASFAGRTGGGYDRTLGRSGIWSPAGVAVARAGAEPGEFVRAEISRPAT